MFSNNLLMAAGASPPPIGFYADIVTAGLTDGLQFSLDAGAIDSYPSGNQWLDQSGNAHHFYLGADGSVSGDEPTHNGTPGDLSSTEYWTFSGNDFFRLAQSNPSWVDDMHQDNAQWSWILWYYGIAVGTNFYYMGTGIGGVGERPSVNHFTNNLERQIVSAFYDTGIAFSPGTHASSLNIGAWNMLGESVDEAVGASGGFHYLNGVETPYTSTYSTPSSNPAAYTLEIAAAGNGVKPVETGCRIGGAMMWSGVALSAANFDTIWAAQKGRFGL